MPRENIHIACRPCRKKRAKCDGQNPCQRCETSEKCEYDHKRWESKKELRAEIERLKRSNEDRDKLLNNSASSRDLDSFGQRGSVDSNKAHEDQPGCADEVVSSSVVSSQKAVLRRESAGFSCFNHLQSWRLCHPSTRDRNLFSETSEQSTILSLPPLPVDAYFSDWHASDTWTQTGWTRAHLRHLFDALATWDYLPFSLICKDQFLQDYRSGSRRFCSSALVHAVLALASRLINENEDDSRVLPSGWLGSEVFLDEAETRLQARKPLNRLPDIQALGILSLYQMRCGREAEAHELAEALLARITELCHRQPLVDEEDENYSRARATTYCGAVSLVRILRLTTGLLFDVPSHTFQDDSLILDELSNGNIGNGEGRSGIRLHLSANNHNSNQYDFQLITAKIFQLTEWVYKFITSARSAPGITSNDIAAVYTKCLGWYESLFALVDRDSTRTPFMLFIHMYYHFCVLCAFRPFVGLAVGKSDIQPHEICMQAAQSILALAQSYDDLFTLRRVSGLVPYFICASGLYGLGMMGSGSVMDAVHLRLRDQTPPIIKLEPHVYETVVGHSGAPAYPLHIKMSAAAHARLLLAKIGSAHLVATAAERMILERA